MKEIAILFSLLFFALLPVTAQYDNVWAFGTRAGIDFNYNPPRAIKTAMDVWEGSASISDASGQLLFFTDGDNVWNREHRPMLNGQNLNRNSSASSSQGAVIVPAPGDSSKYYIFSLSRQEDCWDTTYGCGYLFCSVVDMRKNNGLGAVVSKDNIVDSCLREHMTAVSGNNCDIWLLVISRLSNQIKAYRIDGNGIDPVPVLSEGAPKRGNSISTLTCAGYMQFSSNRKKLVVPLGFSGLTLYDFNPSTGKITNPVILDGATFSARRNTYYGSCFSPDGSKLYTAIIEPPYRLSEKGVFQFNLSSGDSSEIVASRINISGQAGSIDYDFWGMKLGRDGRIYLTAYDKNSLSIIPYPDNLGEACGFELNTFTLSANTWTGLGLPNSPIYVDSTQDYQSVWDTIVCKDRFLLHALEQSKEYVWDDGSKSAQREVLTSGSYWVRYKRQENCMRITQTDSFHVYFDSSRHFVYTVNFDTGMCAADTVFMTPRNPEGSDYLWEDGSTELSRWVNKKGVYWLRYQIDSTCTDYVDTFNVFFPDPEYKVFFTGDTVVCIGDYITFQNTSDPAFHDFVWLLGNGSTYVADNLNYPYPLSGQYVLSLTGSINEHCQDTLSRIVTIDEKIPAFFRLFPDKICRGESVQFYPQMHDESIVRLNWEMGNGSTFSAGDTTFDHAFDAAGIKAIRLNVNFRACPDTFYSDTVYVYDLPVVDLGVDSVICLGALPVTLYNHVAANEKILQYYYWSTGDTNAVLTVRHAGTYNLTVKSSPLGCSNTGEIKISKDCYTDLPNVFTPNGDGTNDHFFPRQLLSKSISSFRMEVYNRWGQKVFETRSMNGQGWDGDFNAQPQPQGVYVYQIQVDYENNSNERYEGNVTLLR